MNWVVTVATSSANRTAGSFHPVEHSFAFGDGSVHFIMRTSIIRPRFFFQQPHICRALLLPRNTQPFGNLSTFIRCSDGQVLQGYE